MDGTYSMHGEGDEKPQILVANTDRKIHLEDAMYIGG
jgi:hypothetical protein